MLLLEARSLRLFLPVEIEARLARAIEMDGFSLGFILAASTGRGDFDAVVAWRELGVEPGAFRLGGQDRTTARIQNVHADRREILAAALRCEEQMQVELAGEGIEFGSFAFADPPRDIANAASALNGR